MLTNTFREMHVSEQLVCACFHVSLLCRSSEIVERRDEKKPSGRAAATLSEPDKLKPFCCCFVFSYGASKDLTQRNVFPISMFCFLK